ncbi:MAG TPA: acetoin dehydrogenase dihydrolipoyllysine-residue acetyltransferase subunit [Roseiarcus sp.]|nr:acetoin dehydrogenase dihydrolipoyllysine-residue acetyltransferase subunit [Roseiarcus sp.]
MAHEIVMPRVDMDLATGRMGAWRAAEGAHVVKGETLFEIETDKAAMEVDAPASGVLRFVAASEGDVLPVGSCIGWVVAEGEDFVPPVTSPRAALATPDSSARADVEENDAVYADAAVGLRATPAARRAARERGLRLADVKGSGPKGRIQARDLEQCAVGEPRMLSVNREWLRRGEGAPIVFIHGLCADLNGWRPLFRLLPETRPALAIDLPGHGLSPLGEEASFDALVDAARSVMIEEGATSAHLVGHSLGGAVAAVLSQAPGVKALSLMLIAPAGLGEETNPAFFDGFLQADDEAALTPWLNLLVTDPASLGSALAPATLRQRTELPLVAAQRRLTKALLANGRQTIDIRDCLAAPRMPVKVVFGLEDRITPAHHAENLSGLVALHRFAKIGHMPHLEARREMARLIVELAGAGAA